jgi:hypothetical protein
MAAGPVTDRERESANFLRVLFNGFFEEKFITLFWVSRRRRKLWHEASDKKIRMELLCLIAHNHR